MMPPSAVHATLEIETCDFAMRGVFRIERDDSGVRLFSTYQCYKMTRGADAFRSWRTDAMLACEGEDVSPSSPHWTYPTYALTHANGELHMGKGVAPIYRPVKVLSIRRLRFITEVGAGEFDGIGGGENGRKLRKVRLCLKRRGDSIVIAHRGTLHLDPLYWDAIRGKHDLYFCDLLDAVAVATNENENESAN